jgi:hypothetical protein
MVGSQPLHHTRRSSTELQHKYGEHLEHQWWRYRLQNLHQKLLIMNCYDGLVYIHYDIEDKKAMEFGTGPFWVGGIHSSKHICTIIQNLTSLTLAIIPSLVVIVNSLLNLTSLRELFIGDTPHRKVSYENQHFKHTGINTSLKLHN